MELRFNRIYIREDIGVIILEVIKYRGPGTVVQKLGALIKKCCVVLICLNNKKI